MRDLREMRGVAYAMGASETPPSDALVLPSYEQVRDDKLAFSRATKTIHNETNPYNARSLVQFHDRQAVVTTPRHTPGSGPPRKNTIDLDGRPGVVGRADRLVKTRRHCAEMAERLLGTTWIVEKLSHAMALAEIAPGQNFVTLAGQHLGLQQFFQSRPPGCRAECKCRNKD